MGKLNAYVFMKLVGNIYDKAKYESFENDEQEEIYDFLYGHADSDFTELYNSDGERLDEDEDEED